MNGLGGQPVQKPTLPFTNGDLVIVGNIAGVENPVCNFISLDGNTCLYFEPCVPTTSNNIWQYVNDAANVSSVTWNVSFNDAVIAFINSKYSLPDGITTFEGSSPAEREAEEIVASRLKFI